MISSTSCGSFVAYTASESPTSKLNPQPVRSSSKWRVSFADSGPLSRRLTSSLAGNGFDREYGEAATAGAGIRASVAAVYDRRNTKSSVVSDRQSRTNIHRALRGGHFLRRLGLFRK